MARATPRGVKVQHTKQTQMINTTIIMLIAITLKAAGLALLLVLLARVSLAVFMIYFKRHRFVTETDECAAAAVIDAGGDPDGTSKNRGEWAEQAWIANTRAAREHAINEAERLGVMPKHIVEAARADLDKGLEQEYWIRFREPDGDMPGDVISVLQTDHCGGKPKRVRMRAITRDQGWRFVRWWVNWGKAEFPGAYRGKREKETDRICIEHRLRSEMRKHSVRDVDIARYLPSIVVGITTPSTSEAQAERMLQTNAVRLRREEAEPVGSATRLLWDVLWGKQPTSAHW